MVKRRGSLHKNQLARQVEFPIVPQLDKCLKFKPIQGDENDCTFHKITPRNALNFRHLSSCGTIVGFDIPHRLKDFLDKVS